MAAKRKRVGWGGGEDYGEWTEDGGRERAGKDVSCWRGKEGRGRGKERGRREGVCVSPEPQTLPSRRRGQ